jgi:hypothetical protein
MLALRRRQFIILVGVRGRMAVPYVRYDPH